MDGRVKRGWEEGRGDLIFRRSGFGTCLRFLVDCDAGWMES